MYLKRERKIPRGGKFKETTERSRMNQFGIWLNDLERRGFPSRCLIERFSCVIENSVTDIDRVSIDKIVQVSKMKVTAA